MEDHNIMKKARNLISKRSIREWYIVSFMLIALIPIGIILGSFYRFNVTALTSDIQDINVQRVSQVQLGFENEVTKHINLAETVYRDKKLMTLMKREEAVHNYEAIIRLNQYLGFRDMDVQTGILVFDKNQVYTRTGLVNQDVYFRNMLSLDDDQTRAIFDAISSKSASDSNIIIPV
ncbi:MAG: hypothetical protein GX768_10790, partial [Chloroflexi bacterium]|nr:hypothetical protein [Chloroflexota bacterium]